jgi:hypothetical protein
VPLVAEVLEGVVEPRHPLGRPDVRPAVVARGRLPAPEREAGENVDAVPEARRFLALNSRALFSESLERLMVSKSEASQRSGVSPGRRCRR